jgi:hypothetical protein
VAGTPSTEIFNPAVAAATFTTGVPGAKSHLLSPTYGSAAGLSVGTANPYYVSPKWYHFCSGVCNVSKANILPMD